MIPGFISIDPWGIIAVLALVALNFLVLLLLTLAGIWLLFRGPRRWLGAGLLGVAAAWSFGPYLLGRYQVARVERAIVAGNITPDMVDLSGKRFAFLGDCSGFCNSLVLSGRADAVYELPAAGAEERQAVLDAPGSFYWNQVRIEAEPFIDGALLTETVPIAEPARDLDYLVVENGRPAPDPDIPGAPRVSLTLGLWAVEAGQVGAPLVYYRQASVSGRWAFLPVATEDWHVPPYAPFSRLFSRWICPEAAAEGNAFCNS